MSYHINATEYECKNCNQVFIAYSKDLPCPRCRTTEDSEGDSYEFIDNMVRSIIINKNQQGCYMPPAWYIASFSDFVQRTVFSIFEELYSSRKKTLVKIIKGFEKEKTDDNKYTVDHIVNIINLVYDRKNEFEHINNSLIGKLKLRFWPK